jgi:hypothetical protein
MLPHGHRKFHLVVLKTTLKVLSAFTVVRNSVGPKILNVIDSLIYLSFKKRISGTFLAYIHAKFTYLCQILQEWIPGTDILMISPDVYTGSEIERPTLSKEFSDCHLNLKPPPVPIQEILP